MHVGFYAPLKSPHHPVPSGDRLMARLLIKAMRLAGYTVSLLSEFRSFSPSPRNFEDLRAAGEVEAARIGLEWAVSGAPDIFFCYHPYYKSPDHLGPALTQRFAIPYVTAEASFSPRRGSGEWAEAHAVATAALRAADLNICITRRDREGLEGIIPADRLAMLAPFLDVSGFEASVRGGAPDSVPIPDPSSEDMHAHTPGSVAVPVRLITVAMMRTGDKLDSYRMLAQAMALCLDVNWQLAIVGDGPCRDEVRGLFAALPLDRLHWLGELSAEQVAEALSTRDVYVWPGFGEAYGLAYLEAQASGLPVVAQQVAGVPEVVVDGRTGLLTTTGDVVSYAAAVRRLMVDADLRSRLGAEAHRFVTAERSMEKAAETLKVLLSRFET
jgi:glycosyltransferase involved in cell wall biosynthesis